MKKAAEMGRPMGLRVLDTHGQLVAFARMDGVRHMSENIAIRRAKVSGYFGKTSESYSSFSAAAATTDADDLSRSRIIYVQGGAPLTRKGELIGGIGCAGGHGERCLGEPDQIIADAGTAALT